MRCIASLFTLAVLLLAFPLRAASENPTAETDLRQTLNFNRDWKFQLGDQTGAEAVIFDDSRWQSIGLPHSFSVPYFLSPDFYVGYGWYRKHFTLPTNCAGKRLFLEFEAAFQDVEIFINARKVGSHKGGYTGFSIDITNAVQIGDNIVAVRLNNLWNPRLAPRAGEHTFSGGLYRDVRFVVTDPLHVAWCGTFVTTPQVSKESATVNVKTEVVNDSSMEKSATVKQMILDPDGRLVTEVESTQQMLANTTVLFDQTTQSIATPKLWHPDHPFLYTVKTTVLDHAKPVDAYASPLGFRWMKWTPDQGFFLNGEHLYLRGANVHQDHAGWGDAVTNAGFERDVKMLKDAGFNFIRGSHYPRDPAFCEACDRLGILLWSENSFWGIGGFQPDGYWNSSAYPPHAQDQPEFEASVKQELREMIRIHRNHPCIIAWSMCNEPFFTEKSAIPKMKAFLEQLVAYSHELDPTRPAAIGGAQRPLDQNRIDTVGDIAGYNGDGSSIPLFQNPGVSNLVSEYGSTVADRPGKYAPGWGDLAKENGEFVHPWRSGQAIWCAFDHGSIAGARFGKMGLIDYFRIPKRAYYWYRNAYAHLPPPAWPAPGTSAQLKLEADQITGVRTDGTDDVKLIVTILNAAGTPISNSPPVELTTLSGPGEFPTGPSIKFEEHSDIQILDGQAAIEYRSYYAGETLIRATSPGLAPAEVKIHFDGPVAYVPGHTPSASSRPYMRFSKKDQSNIQQHFGRDNPTFATSAANGHAAGLAADGNAKTYWQAASDDKKPSWTLDMEKFVAISRIRILFPEEEAYRYNVEVSDDQTNWRPIADMTQNAQKENSHQIAPDRDTIARFIRIRFPIPGPAPRLSEIEVTGTVHN